ncbi:MAG: ParB/RepB/Spo0J family partition protein [Erysipelotrichaceae bacterium]|nr:ParB/RepB/Spo0J family partition protein [Erysipelotrichaceae bacterium]
MKQLMSVNIEDIKANPYQPRNSFEEQSLQQLAVSIHNNGLLQPVLLRKDEDGYQLIAGERRLRACRLLGMKQVDALIIEADDCQSSMMAIIENIQRENLNPIDEANGYLQLLRMSGFTQSQLANQLGRSQGSIANKLRLLNLTDEAQEAIASGDISERHGRALLSVESEKQNQILKRIIDRNLTVAQTESYISSSFSKPKKKPRSKSFGIPLELSLNSIRETIRQLKEAGADISVDENETNDKYQMTITIKK